ncbi:Tyrosinase_Cu-bd domain-containing protein, partial [Meloidogyne graminicola]
MGLINFCILFELLIILLLLNKINAIPNCDSFPRELRATCRIMVAAPPGSGDLPPDRGELQCDNFGCFCNALGGESKGKNDCTLQNGNKLKKCIRKELRMLTSKELQTWKDTLNLMKTNNDYDLAAALHRNAWQDGGAHNGPSFYPWHREYLKVFELMGRLALYKDRQSTDFCLPYWDSTMESRLPTPKDSCLFTSSFVGKTNASGIVVDGPFSPWQTIEDPPSPYLTRNVGRDGSCYREHYITWEMQQKNITNILAYTMPDSPCPYEVNSNYPEYPHGSVHTFVGGYMTFPDTSANDPIFHTHHCFVDLTWELWRQKQQTYAQRPLAYPTDIADCERPIHFRNEKMSQFPYLKNIDGCKNEYTDNLYSYASRPTCGNCRGFTNVCYKGSCVDNVCVPKSEETTTEIPKTTTATVIPTTIPTTTTTVIPTTTTIPTTTPSTSTTTINLTSTIVQTTTKTSTNIPSTTTETPTTTKVNVYPDCDDCDLEYLEIIFENKNNFLLI